MKVRATQDGTYGGYYRHGPQAVGTAEYVPGEVFEIDEKPFPVKDHLTGEPVYERDIDGSILFEMENGKPKMDKNGKKIPKVKMSSWFSPNWMERVNEDATITEELPPFQIPVQMRAVKPPKQVTEATPVTLKQLENVI